MNRNEMNMNECKDVHAVHAPVSGSACAQAVQVCSGACASQSCVVAGRQEWEGELGELGVFTVKLVFRAAGVHACLPVCLAPLAHCAGAGLSPCCGCVHVRCAGSSTRRRWGSA